MGSRKIAILGLALALAAFCLPVFADGSGRSGLPAASGPPPASGPPAAYGLPPASGPAVSAPGPARICKPLTLNQTDVKKHLDGGVRLEADLVYNLAGNNFAIRAKALPFLTAGGFELSLIAFDNLVLPLDEKNLRAWRPPGKGFLNTARHILKFVGRIRYGTPKSKFHFNLGPREPLDFAPSSFIATMDSGFDRFRKPDGRRLALCVARNSDLWDFAMFLDDLDKSASGKLRGGLRVVGSPFKSYRLAIGAGAYMMLATLKPFLPRLAPFVDLTFPIVDKSSFNLAFSATALCGLFRGRAKGGRLDDFMIEGRFPIQARSGKLKIEIAVAWNKGHRFSSAINDTRALDVGGCFDLSDPAFDRSSIDLVLKIDAKPSRSFFLFGYLDIPFKYGPDGGSLAGSATGGLGSDVAMLKIGWQKSVWSCAFKYSIMGFSSRLWEILGSFKDPSASKPQAFGALVGGRYAIAALESRFELGLLTLALDLGFDTNKETRPYGVLRIGLDLSKKGFSGSKGAKGE